MPEPEASQASNVSYNKGEVRHKYNPFRKLNRRIKYTHDEDAHEPRDEIHASFPIANYVEPPYMVGQLFSPVDLKFDPAAGDQFPTLGEEPRVAKPSRPIDEERTLFLAGSNRSGIIFSSPTFLLNRLYRFWIGSASTRALDSSLADPAPKQHSRSRKRRVIVVEYGNTDEVTEITAESVRRSWNEPQYSEIAIPGYPTDETGHQKSRKSSALAVPLKESLRKFMPQKGTSNLRIFYIQDDREAFLCLGQAFHMTFFGHRTNFRAWSIGPGNLKDTGKPQWLEDLEVRLSPVQTMFWRPDRTGDIIRTAFGMEYLILHVQETSSDIIQDHLQEGHDMKYKDLLQVPESCEQRIAVYIQLKKHSNAAQFSRTPSLGLGENSVIVFDSMRKGVTSDEFLDGVLSWKQLMYDVDIEDPLLGNPVLIAAIRLVFDAIAGKWSDYILSMQYYIVSVEEIIYNQPANDKYSSLLWTISKRLLQAERLLKFHLHLLENVQNELVDITGPKTMEPDWLRLNLKEFARLSSEVEESLRKPVAQMVDLMYKSIGIRDARQSLELNTSLWRLSWITFIFLPLTFLAGFFGMNVSELRSEPPIKWYFAAAIPLTLTLQASTAPDAGSTRCINRRYVDTQIPSSPSAIRMETFRLILGLLFYIYTADSESIPLKPDNATLRSLHVSPDPRFQINAGYDLPKLNPTSCMMNAVNALAILAELDYLSRLRGTRRVFLSAYNDVQIEFDPIPPATNIEIRIMVWGLYAGIYDMIVNHKFRDAEFDLSWEGIAVAWIRFQRPSRRLGNAVFSLSDATDPAISLNNTKTNQALTNGLDIATNVATPGTPQVFFSYFDRGHTMNMETIILTVAATLKDLAAHRASDTLIPFASNAEGLSASMGFHTDSQPRTTSPIFRYKWAIDATKQVPGYMLAHRRFAELAIVITVDGVMVGSGFIEKGGLGREMGGRGDVKPAFNVSVA